MSLTVLDNGSITDVRGIRAAGVHCGLKKNGNLDLALLVSEAPASAAAVFTTNRFQAAPVIYDHTVVQCNPRGIRAVAVNSGCANACTGPEGEEDAREMARLAAAVADVGANQVLIMSTGVIGQRLNMEKIAAGMQAAGAALSAEGGHTAARAIMTTDTHPKECAVRLEIGGYTVTVAGMAKGAGMISPKMATMLSTIVCDAAVAPDTLAEMLRRAVAVSFNCITVDGDMSTNDTLLLLANGMAGNAEICCPDCAGYDALQEAITFVATELAKGVAFDGEGATKKITILMRGGRTFEEAQQAGMAIAKSPLVKTAIYGKDANWGRVVCAVGYSGVPVDPNQVEMWLGDLHLVHLGRPYQIDEEKAALILDKSEITIIVDLGMGQEEATIYTCDFSHEYVSINANYRT